MEQFVTVTLAGVAQGAVLAAFALALVMIWRATRVVNFAQGAMAMFTTYLALAVVEAGGSYWAGFGLALAAGFVLGALVERLVVRHVEGGPELNAVIVTLGLFVAIQALAALLFGATFRSFPAAADVRGTSIAGTDVAFTQDDLFTVGSVAVLLVLLVLLFRRTDLGLRMRAAALAPEVARLLGVRVGRMLTLGWALAAVAGSLAGLLVAGGNLVHPAYMDTIVVHGFVAAVLGGLDSPAGAVIGGLVLGLCLAWVSGYVAGELATPAALVVLVTVLMLRPGGLLGRQAVRRV